MIRLLDLFLSIVGLILLSPLFLLVSLWIAIDSGMPVFYIQKRVGKNGVDFDLFKFRTMRKDSDKKGLLTVGGNDSRITNSGLFLRKFKLDELPQLFNVLVGDMSFVGPRPEVRKYVELYNEEQRSVLTVRPGITDLASIEYMDENSILGKSSDPERTYIEEIMPHKIEINLRYINNPGLSSYLSIILKTVYSIVR